MKYQCTITRRSDGRWSAQHSGTDIGAIEVTADTRETAIQKIENEVRYRVEMCPCKSLTMAFKLMPPEPPPVRPR